MKVWTMYHHSYGEIHVLSEGSDLLKYRPISAELEALEGDEYLEEERTEFIHDIDRIRARGYGTASIEERFDLELVEVKEV